MQPSVGNLLKEEYCQANWLVVAHAATLPGPTGDITVTQTDGTQFSVQVNGVSTPSQLIAAINNATGNTGVTAALNAAGNGITLTDASGGAGNLSVAAAANYNGEGSDLGIFQTGAGRHAHRHGHHLLHR